MEVISIAEYTNLTALQLVEQLNENYYKLITILSRHIDELADFLKTRKGADDSLNLGPYSELTNEVRSYVNLRQRDFLPYISELVEKDTSGHNCSTCAGGCDMHHASRLMDFKVSLLNIKKAMHEVKEKITGSFSEEKEYKLLQYMHGLLDSIINELIVIEEDYLLPKIQNSQRNINAAN